MILGCDFLGHSKIFYLTIGRNIMHTIDKRNNQKDYLGPANKTRAIFLISILGLFLEMLLIRWISTEIRIFAYLQNTVLVVCFMGLGVGCFTSRQPIVLRKMLIPLFILTLLFAIPITRRAMGYTSEMLNSLGDFVIWVDSIKTSLWQTIFCVVIGIGMAYILMVMIVDVFVPIGRLLGRLMDDHPRTIWAYSVNVSGSLVGIWLFVLISAFYQPPVTWFAVMGVLTAFFLNINSKEKKVNIALIAGIIVLSWFAGKDFGSINVVWSPYQKLNLKEWKHGDKVVDDNYLITVNNTGYQAMLDLNESKIRSNPQQYPPEMRGLSQYPLLFRNMQ